MIGFVFAISCLPIAASAAVAVPPHDREAAARPLFAIIYRAGPAWKAGVPMKDQGLREHFLYVKSLHARGDVVYAGALGSNGGLMLIHAADQAGADAVIAADPAVRAGIFVAEARRFVPSFTGTGAARAAGGGWTPIRPWRATG